MQFLERHIELLGTCFQTATKEKARAELHMAMTDQDNLGSGDEMITWVVSPWLCLEAFNIMISIAFDNFCKKRILHTEKEYTTLKYTQNSIINYIEGTVLQKLKQKEHFLMTRGNTVYSLCDLRRLVLNILHQFFLRTSMTNNFSSTLLIFGVCCRMLSSTLRWILCSLSFPTNASGLTLFKDMFIQRYKALLKRVVRTLSPHRPQEFTQNISKAIVIQSLQQ